MKDIDSLKSFIKEHVSLGELLKQDGHITNLLDEEQFSCKFHGPDNKKSARYYRSTDTCYCWVCKRVLDVISYVQERDELTFKEAIRFFIREYYINISHLPESTEENIRKTKEIIKPKVDNKKLKIEKLKEAILAVREDIEYPIYIKFIYSYMLLNYVIPEEKFDEQYKKLKEAMLKVFNRINKEEGNNVRRS